MNQHQHIPLVPVKSSQISAVGYDAATKTLAVTFARGGAVYHYPNVEPKTHAEFIGAESIGKFFGKHIKSLPFTKHEPPTATPAPATLKPQSAWPFPSKSR